MWGTLDDVVLFLCMVHGRSLSDAGPAGYGQKE